MTKKRFDEMSEAEFDGLIDGYIERTATGYGEMPADIFLDLLTERMADKVSETVNLSIDMGLIYRHGPCLSTWAKMMTW